MAKFKVKVIREDEYEIEVDENVYNEEWLKQFREVFYDLENREEVASFLARYQARNGTENGFIEGFGWVKRNSKLPFSSEDFDKNGNWLPEDERRQAAPGLNIVIIDEDNSIDIEITEVEDEK